LPNRASPKTERCSRAPRSLITYADGLDITNRPDDTGGYEDLKRGARHEPRGEELHIAITSLENIIAQDRRRPRQ
jgi:hypothetical protein